ncbi:MarR family transcriptional regulator [Streptomyces antioxidans]|uniref:MarR family transcriptional regulator n=1 Tax=Streptomyces antioxidans TaxID=1507734 RepID=A0A1V4D0H3_9ACTN|nr:MarR family transcriptional regulator [Streptomyces antioxidans]OPF75407.1 MarR family transcriptional regulator [Streptomyces antioxidans]
MPDEMALLVADVYEAAGVLRRSGEAVAAAEGQTQARWQLLSVVSDSPRSVAQAARRLGISRQAAQRVANDLVHAELAAFRPNPDHRSSPLLALTSAGEDVLDRITARAAEAHEAFARGIPPEEVRAARALLHRLVERVRDHEDEGARARNAR